MKSRVIKSNMEIVSVSDKEFSKEEKIMAFNMEDKIKKSIESLNTTKQNVISIGDSINPIIATKQDLSKVEYLKEVIKKLDDCKNILESINNVSNEALSDDLAEDNIEILC